MDVIKISPPPLITCQLPSISSPTQKPENQPQQDRILKFTEKWELPKRQTIETLREGLALPSLRPRAERSNRRWSVRNGKNHLTK